MIRSFVSRLFGPVRIAAASALVTVLLLALLAPRLADFAGSALRRLSARTVTVTSGPVLVERLQTLNRLETARQVSQHVVEARSEGLPLPQFLVGDKLLMRIQTEAVAGVDLSRLSPGDVRLEGSSAVIRLPEPEIFSVRVEDEHSRVYDRQRGWLVLKPDPDLERQARLQAQADARRGALEGEMMGTARANAEQSLRALLAPFGLEDVRFEWGASPAAEASEAPAPAG